MKRYYIICENSGHVIKDYYLADSIQEALDVFEKDYGKDGYEITVLFLCDS